MTPFICVRSLWMPHFLVCPDFIFSSRRNSEEQALTFNELLQVRRKMLASYQPSNNTDPKNELPEWMKTRASIFKKNVDMPLDEPNTLPSIDEQVRVQGPSCQTVSKSSDLGLISSDIG